jgi:predicted component of type VI protein secretion system
VYDFLLAIVNPNVSDQMHTSPEFLLRTHWRDVYAHSASAAAAISIKWLSHAGRKGTARMDARLKILAGPLSGQTISIPVGKLLIGREDDCHLRSTSEFVSRHHCVLLLDEYTLRIRDLGSQNGTFVNGRRIVRGEHILLHGDAVSVGDLDFHIDCDEATSEDPRLGSEKPPAALQGTGVFDGETLRGNSPDVTPQTPPSTPTTTRRVPPETSAPAADGSASGQ